MHCAWIALVEEAEVASPEELQVFWWPCSQIP